LPHPLCTKRYSSTPAPAHIVPTPFTRSKQSAPPHCPRQLLRGSGPSASAIRLPVTKKPGRPHRRPGSQFNAPVRPTHSIGSDDHRIIIARIFILLLGMAVAGAEVVVPRIA